MIIRGDKSGRYSVIFARERGTAHIVTVAVMTSGATIATFFATLQWLNILTPLGIVLGLAAIGAGIYFQVRTAGETRARELWQQEAEALRTRLKTEEEDNVRLQAKNNEMATTNMVLAKQVTNTETIVEVEHRLRSRIDTVESKMIDAIERAVSTTATRRRTTPAKPKPAKEA